MKQTFGIECAAAPHAAHPASGGVGRGEGA